MPSQDISTPAVLPVFVLEKWVPDGSTVYDICLAAEKITGPGSIDGATCIKGLWRVYPMNEIARVKILTKGITIGKKLVRFECFNHFSRGNGQESTGTRLTISNLPFSYSNDAVARNLAAAGLKLRSKISFEKARGPDRMLTDWRTGRRSVWIDLPQHEVSRHFKMGEFSAFLYYKEMKSSMECRRCLEKGHMARDCPNEEVCYDCKKPGHRRGHLECEFSHDESIWGPSGGQTVHADGHSEYVWGNPASNDVVENGVVDDKSQKSDEVGTDVDHEDSGEEECDEVVDKEQEEAECRNELTGKENEISQEDKEADKNKDVSISDISGKSHGTFEKGISGSNNTADSDETKKTSIEGNKASELGENETKHSDDKVVTPKSKRQMKRKQKQKNKSQQSIEKFIEGKRQIEDISSPGDGKSGSPDEKSQKTTS